MTLSMRSIAASTLAVSAPWLRRANSSRNQRPRALSIMAAQIASYSSSAGGGGGIIDDASDFSDIGATGLERNAIWREEARYDHHDRSGSAIGVMAGNPHIPTGSGFAWRLAAFYAALFTALGVQLPFLPVWLAAKGLDAGAIGMVLAIPMVVRVFAIPLAARTADHYDALRTAIAIAGAAAVLGYGALALAHGTVAIMATFAFASACYTPLMPLADAYAFLGLRRRTADGEFPRPGLPAYGPVRLWGSAAFMAGSFGAGLLLDLIAPRDLIWLVVVAMMLAAAAAWVLVPLPGGETPARRPPRSPSGLLRERAFLAMAAAARSEEHTSELQSLAYLVCRL